MILMENRLGWIKEVVLNQTPSATLGAVSQAAEHIQKANSWEKKFSLLFGLLEDMKAPLFHLCQTMIFALLIFLVFVFS